MKIKIVTITGADNNTNVNDMFEISKQYPFVEWGILFSPKRIGEERYPDFNWLADLMGKWLGEKINLSAHLCGGYTRELLIGSTELIKSAPIRNCLEIFNRFQLNFNANRHHPSEDFLPLIFAMGKDFILQYNSNNVSICVDAMKSVYNVSFLYDSSGGLGKIEEQWKPPFMGFFTGYAGGLSPDNLKEELSKIESVVGDREIWIDTETHVRTNGILDMDKVKKFLEIASKYI